MKTLSVKVLHLRETKALLERRPFLGLVQQEYIIENFIGRRKQQKHRMNIIKFKKEYPSEKIKQLQNQLLNQVYFPPNVDSSHPSLL
jgi:hypothetical protein